MPGHFVQKQTVPVIFEENPKWQTYKGKFFCQIGPLSRDRARILYLIILCLRPRQFEVNWLHTAQFLVKAYTSSMCTQAVLASKEESAAPHPLRKRASSTLLSQTTPAEARHHIDKREC